VASDLIVQQEYRDAAAGGGYGGAPGHDAHLLHTLSALQLLALCDALGEADARATAAYLAGLQSGLCPEPARFAETWVLERRFTPTMATDVRAAKYARWGRAVAATLMV
jgi:hypothetical protein